MRAEHVSALDAAESESVFTVLIIRCRCERSSGGFGDRVSSEPADAPTTICGQAPRTMSPLAVTATTRSTCCVNLDVVLGFRSNMSVTRWLAVEFLVRTANLVAGVK